MKLLVILFILKLYAKISIFKYIPEKYGQEHGHDHDHDHDQI